MRNIGKAIIVVGLAAVSVWCCIATDGESGSGWGVLSILVLFFMD